MSSPNKQIGNEAEERIARHLESFNLEVEPKNGLHPDIRFKIEDEWYNAECKSILAVHKGGRLGVAKMVRPEYEALRDMALTEPTCMIVEVRSLSRGNYVYFFVPISALIELVEAKSFPTPKQFSLTLYWVLKEGMNLEAWIRVIKGWEKERLCSFARRGECFHVETDGGAYCHGHRSLRNEAMQDHDYEIQEACMWPRN